MNLFLNVSATRYVFGVYFATSANFSHRYTDQRGGHRKMLLADVITGQFAQRNQSMRYSPLLPGNTTDLYDSVVDNVDDPAIFVVFEDASVFPLYILTYTQDR